ncbi:MAG: beta-N-acetylhexosaminidase [Hyphomicrobium sp.]
MSRKAKHQPRAVVFGLSGPTLTRPERSLFIDANPLGFILFARNCIDPAQVRALVADLRATVGRADAPVLVDQEGGRVARLRPPHWREAPAAARFAELARTSKARAKQAAWLNARMLAADLAEMGITVDCAPVLDVPQPGAHEVIGDRAVGDTAERSAMLGRAWCEGLLAGGVLPVIKHIPGHGRALVDSHVRLPVVTAERADLERVDFAPFHALRTMPWAMTAHVVFSALDPLSPATTSPIVIGAVIRGAIGFRGLLVSDDICMAALGGSVDARASAALGAGCDIVLHCNGALTEMEAVAAACPPISSNVQAKLLRAETMRLRPGTFDRTAAATRLAALMDGAAEIA